MQNTDKNKNRHHEVAITGMGIISAIGNDISTTLQCLQTSKSGLSTIENIETKLASKMMVGEVKKTNIQLQEQLGIKPPNNFSRTALLGCMAAKQAMENANLLEVKKRRVGLISATTVGGMDTTERYFKQFATHPDTQRYLESHPAGDSTQKIAEYLGVTHFSTTISTACSSAANAIMLGARMIKAGKLDAVVVGGTDALSKYTINGFSSLMILTETKNAPFDRDRKGLNLGEGAAFLVLESREMVENQKKGVLGYVAGYGNANDSYHQTASSEKGDGAFLAMQKALNTANLKPSQIDYINAHGTATLNNDASESEALLRIFGNYVPDFSSTKPFTGHTLAAAGAIEAVISLLSLQENSIFPNLNFKILMEKTRLVPVTAHIEKPLQYVLSNSFGFGGNCSTLILRKS